MQRALRLRLALLLVRASPFGCACASPPCRPLDIQPSFTHQDDPCAHFGSQTCPC